MNRESCSHSNDLPHVRFIRAIEEEEISQTEDFSLHPEFSANLPHSVTSDSDLESENFKDLRTSQSRTSPQVNEPEILYSSNNSPFSTIQEQCSKVILDKVL